jgi:ribonuclease T
MHNTLPIEFFVSVDVETAGPVPSLYSLLAIGACTLTEPQETFYIELKPVNMDFQEEALASCNLSMEKLAVTGIDPAQALERFEGWLQKVTPLEVKPIFVGFNAPFDWMFVNDYFHRFLKRNPFGHAAVDIKSYAMGLHRSTWNKTTMRHIGPRYLNQEALVHHALRDALDQGIIFSKMLKEAEAAK